MPRPTHPDPADCQANYNALRRQLHALVDFQNDPAQWEALVEHLVEDDPRIVALDLRLDDGPDRPPVLALKNEIYVRIEVGAGGRDAVDATLIEFGFNPEPADDPACGPIEFADREAVVTRHVALGDDADLVGAINALDALDGVTSAPRALRAMNVVTKGKSGAEPACCHPRRRWGWWGWLKAWYRRITNRFLSRNRGEGLVVVIDTGKFLDGHRAGLLNGVTGEDDPRLDDGGYLNLSAGHGTAVAGIVRQVSRHTRIHVTKVINPKGVAEDGELAEAITAAGAYIERNGGHGVINLSLGDESYNQTGPPVVERALAALPEGVVVVAAAGNSNLDRPVYPAAFSADFQHVVAVASLDANGDGSQWCNRAPWVTFSAVGEGVITTFVEGNERRGTEPSDPYDLEPDCWVGPRPWALCTGTSFAAPQVAARLAAILARGVSREAAVTALRDEIKAGGGQEIPGFGLPLPKAKHLIVAQKPTRPAGEPNPEP